MHEKMRNKYNILAANVKGRDHLSYQGTDGRVTKWILRVLGMRT
jgi:hypothetical protein